MKKTIKPIKKPGGLKRRTGIKTGRIPSNIPTGVRVTAVKPFQKMRR